MLDRLAERDYVVREPHETDRRRLVVRLTPAGRDCIFAQVHGMAGSVVAASRRLDADQRRTVAVYIEEIAGVIGAPVE